MNANPFGKPAAVLSVLLLAVAILTVALLAGACSSARDYRSPLDNERICPKFKETPCWIGPDGRLYRY